MTSPPPSETGATAEELFEQFLADWKELPNIDPEASAEEDRREIAATDDLNAWKRVELTRLVEAAKRSAHLEDAGLPGHLVGDGPCSRCGTTQNIVWFTENVLWNNTVRATMEVEPILCINCFVRVVDEAGYSPTGWRLLAEWPWRKVER